MKQSSGAYYWNDFLSMNDTTDSGTVTLNTAPPGTITVAGGSYVATPNAIPTTDYMVIVRMQNFSTLSSYVGARLNSSGSVTYDYTELAYEGATSLYLYGPPSSAYTALTVPSLAASTYYEFAYLIRGTAASGNLNVWGGVAYNGLQAGVQGTVAPGNMSGETAGYAGLFSDQSSVLVDYVLVCGWVITVRGLANGMQFQVLRGTAPVAKSSPSSGGVCTLDLSTFTTLSSFPPYDGIQVINTDGSIATRYYSYRGVFGGDVYGTSVIQSVDATAPYLGPVSVNRQALGMLAMSGAYPSFVDAQISAVSPNTLGQFDVWIPDPEGNEQYNFLRGCPVWFYGLVGPYYGAPILSGVVDRVTPHRLPGGVQVLEVAGMDWAGGWMNAHGYNATTSYQGENAAVILGSDVAQGVPEVQIGPSLQVPSIPVQSDTIIVGRSFWDCSVEFSILSSSDRTDWGVWGCSGQHVGEMKPNLHLSPINQGATLLPILTNRVFKLLAPNDRRQAVTLAVVHFSYTYNYNTTDCVWAYSSLRSMIRAAPNHPASDSPYSQLGYGSDITSAPNYVAQAGDCLEYDVYLTNANSRLFMDLAYMGIAAITDPFAGTTVGSGGSATKPTSGTTYTANEGIAIIIGAGTAQTITTKDPNGSIIDNAVPTLGSSIAPRFLLPGSTLLVTATTVGTTTVYTGGLLSQVPNVQDACGIPVNPTSVIGNVAVNQWYHRRIPLPSSWVGLTLQMYIVQDNPAQAGDFVGALRHIYITNGGAAASYVINQVIWDGNGTTTTFDCVLDNNCMQITRALGSPVTTVSFPYLGYGHPVFGIFPKMLDQPWMTSAQSQTYGQLYVKDLADGVQQIQVWMNLDGRYGQGQYAPVWDALSWGSAIIQSITYDFTRRVQEVTLAVSTGRSAKLIKVRGY